MKPNETRGEISLQPATRAHQPAIIELIGSVYEEYGERICLEDADQDLLDLESSYAAKGGAFVVLTETASSTSGENQSVVGCHAVLPLVDRPGRCTFRRLYVHPRLRGSGAGETLMNWAINAAEERGFHHVGFWSDTRFHRAHRFFARLKFQADGRTREMRDGFEPYREYYFERELQPRRRS